MKEDEIPYLDLVPDECKSRVNGELCFNELGMIYFLTIIEQKHPEKAEVARRLRLILSAEARELRTGRE